MHHREQLRAYQRAAVRFIKEKKRCALFVDPGLGKTASSLTALCDLIDEIECGRTLILAPPQVATKTWHRELLNWMHTKNKSYVIIQGTPAQRRALLKREACFHIMSMEILPWFLKEMGGDIPRFTKVLGGKITSDDTGHYLTIPAHRKGSDFDGEEVEAKERRLEIGEVVKTPDGNLYRVNADGKLGKSRKKTALTYEPGDNIKVNNSGWKSPASLPYDAIVVDESSKVKSSNTNRWRALKHLAFLVEYFIELTGTPSANSLEDLWAQIYLLDGGQRLGGTITAFRERWFAPSYDGHGYTVQSWAVKIIEDRIADIVFTLREADYSNLPPRIYDYKKLTLEKAVMDKYRKFERQYILELAEGKTLRAGDGAIITTKLLQLASGVVYHEEGEGDARERKEHEFHKVKLDALGDLVDELYGEPLLVAYEFQSDVRRILEKFPDAKRFNGKMEMQDAWNRGEIPMMLVHRKSAAHGLNLQFGGSHVVWYGLTYSLEDYIQLNKRLHRSGQTKPVMIHHFIAEGTIDEDVMKALAAKDKMQEALLNALKLRVEQYVKQS